MFRLRNDEKQFFSLVVKETLEYGDVKVEVAFDLAWASGKVEVICSNERLDELRASLAARTEDIDKEIDFISDEGNLELKIIPQTLGSIELMAIMIPSMANEDKIECCIVGYLESNGQSH
jgi:hypothetical protein